MIHNEREKTAEKALLCAVGQSESQAAESLEELAELAKSAGAQVLGRVIQVQKKPVSATYAGAGKLEEIKLLCDAQEIDLFIVDDELSPMQQRNIEQILGVRVIDRTLLILDIFAQMAHSREGRIQVELAQLNYLLPRLSGSGAGLSRLGGGIGTRGPGESKLESDRRHIRSRIHALGLQLRRIERHRGEIRRRRKKNAVLVAAIVGYTNAGKSTLMNALTDAGVLVEDRLFATLDPTVRALELGDGRQILLADTVGFIRKLPHHLVKAFHSTLEEAALADIILNVCDASSPHALEHLKVTTDLLEELGCTGKPIISVMNKCDLLENTEGLLTGGRTVLVSAKNRTGLDSLLAAIEQAIPAARLEVELCLPYSRGDLLAKLKSGAEVYAEQFLEEGVLIRARMDPATLEQVQPYIL